MLNIFDSMDRHSTPQRQPSSEAKHSGFNDTLRRILEVAGSTVLILLTSPLFLITALAIWATDPGPILYRQTRAGLYGVPFQLMKFRSMRVNSRPLDSPEEIGPNHPLVFPVGRLIRRLKVDELPQLINVLLGDMSLIGPRPTVLEQVQKYTSFQRRRLNVLPGMTGWTQVSGGTELTWPERIIMEVWYVEHRSIFLDMKILFRTTSVILHGYRLNRRALQEAMQFAEQEADPLELGLPQLGPSYDLR